MWSTERKGRRKKLGHQNQLHPLRSNGWKRERCGSSPVGDTACCLRRQFPGRLALLPTPACIMPRNHRVLLGLAVSQLCLDSSPCFLHGIPFPAPFPATPTQTRSGSFLFLIQSLCKQCHNLSGAEHDICLMEMLALLWINPNSFSQRACETMRQIYCTGRQSSLYYVCNHK